MAWWYHQNATELTVQTQTNYRKQSSTQKFTAWAFEQQEPKAALGLATRHLDE